MTLRYRSEPGVRRGRLRALLDAGRFVRVIEAHSGLSGLVANTASITLADGTVKEFDGLWCSSFTGSAVQGYPDAEILDLGARLPDIEEMLFVTGKPLVVDGDSGMDPVHFEYYCARLESMGVSAVIIEDKTFPKRNSLDPAARQQLEQPDAFAEKIRRGKSVLLSADFMVIARLESLIAGRGQQDALSRAEAYLRAGADGIVIHSKSPRPDEVMAFARAYAELCRNLGFRKPLVSIPTTYAAVTEAELRDCGFDMVIYANHLLRASYAAMKKVCGLILQNCRSLETEPLCAPVREVADAVGFSEVTRKDRERAAQQPQVIIPAAGRPGRELVERFGDLPSCSLPLKGKTVLQRQMEALAGLGLTEVCVVTGFAAAALEPGQAKVIHNPDFERTYILDSLFRAEDHMSQGFVLSYADILFDPHVIEDLLRCRRDIAVVVDSTCILQKNPAGKTIELVAVNPAAATYYRRLTPASHEVKLIGNRISPEAATHEFTGIAGFSARGAEILKQVYHDCRKKYDGRRFQEAADFRTAGLTDLLQEVIDRGFTVHALEVNLGWTELQSLADYRNAESMVP